MEFGTFCFQRLLHTVQTEMFLHKTHRYSSFVSCLGIISQQNIETTFLKIWGFLTQGQKSKGRY